MNCVLKLENLTKSYNNLDFSLSNINLNLKSGEILGLIGKSGAGKSTLLRCLNALESPTSGKVLFKDKDLASLSANKLRQARQKIGMIFQHFNLLESRNIFDNIALPQEIAGINKAKICKKTMELLGFVGLESFKFKYPDSLSGGQKQRVAIARALALDPEVLLCDEATSALDPQTTTEILQLLKRANSKFKVSIVLITHQMEVVKQVCHRVGVLDSGKLVEIGSVIDIFVNPKSDAAIRLKDELFSLHLPADLAKKLHKEPRPSSKPIIKTIFVGESAKVPVAAILYEKFGIKTNILQADLGQIGGQGVGFTVGLWDGKLNKIKNAKTYLQKLNIKFEEVGYV